MAKWSIAHINETRMPWAETAVRVRHVVGKRGNKATGFKNRLRNSLLGEQKAIGLERHGEKFFKKKRPFIQLLQGLGARMNGGPDQDKEASFVLCCGGGAGVLDVCCHTRKCVPKGRSFLGMAAPSQFYPAPPLCFSPLKKKRPLSENTPIQKTGEP